MIDGNDEDGYTLVCDNCGDESDECFTTFFDAVEYKTDKDNKWRSVKGVSDEWAELCPACNQPGIIAEFRGIKEPQTPKQSGEALARLAGMDTSEFEGF